MGVDSIINCVFVMEIATLRWFNQIGKKEKKKNMNIKFKYRCHLSYVFVGVINFTRPSHREENGYTPHNFFFFYLFIFSSAIKKNGSAGGAIAQRAIFERKNIYFIFFFLKSDPFVIFFLEPSR